MKNLIVLFTLIITLNTNSDQTSITVDRIEKGITEDFAVVEVYHNGTTKMIDIPQLKFNTPKTEGEKLNYSVAIGIFEAEFYNPLDGLTYYQFKSYDDAVWWSLTAEEINFIPITNKPYKLIYYNNNTVDCFECASFYECECEVYDDIFLMLAEV